MRGTSLTAEADRWMARLRVRVKTDVLHRVRQLASSLWRTGAGDVLQHSNGGIDISRDTSGFEECKWSGRHLRSGAWHLGGVLSGGRLQKGRIDMNAS